RHGRLPGQALPASQAAVHGGPLPPRQPPGRVGWVEPKAKPTMSMSVIHSRKIIETALLRRWVVSTVLCEQCATWRQVVSMVLCEQYITWTRWVSRSLYPPYHRTNVSGCFRANPAPDEPPVPRIPPHH